MSNYSAIVCKLENVHKHSNADRLLVAEAAGEPVVIGLEHTEGEIGVFLPAGTVINHNFLLENRLYRKNPITDEVIGGYVEQNRRIRFQRLRGEMSRGVWLPLTCLDYLCLKEYPVLGTEFQELEGHEIIQKYVAASTSQVQGKPGKPRSKKFENFYEIGETPKLVLNYKRFKINDLLVITEKLHGTSGRTGYLPIIERPEKNWFKRQVNNLVTKLGYKKDREYGYVTGTRRMVLGENSPDDNNYRVQVHNHIKPFLSKGMIVYYEIVGKVAGMQTHTPHGITDKILKQDLLEEYGESIDYTYGVPNGLHDFYIYKIVTHDVDGNAIVYSWDQLVAWCNLKGLKHVPVLETMLFNLPAICYESTDEDLYPELEVDSDAWKFAVAKDNLQYIVSALCEGSSVLDQRHPTEGVVLQTRHGAFKHKSNVFCLLEDIRPYEEPEDEVIEDEG